MRHRLLGIIAVIAGLLYIAGIALAASVSQPASAPAAQTETTNSPPTVNLAIAEPATLDPSKAEDTASARVIEQLFIGLVDMNDTTGDVEPELATNWVKSPQDDVYTFTLRSDVRWTDGTPVTAEDARYGILRSLEPVSDTPYYNQFLFPIKNAEAYNDGTVTDANQVGVTAVNSTTLRLTLGEPAAHILAALSLWPARPMPRSAIETWGEAWTDPAHIVTNGAYRLGEQVAGDHIVLEKNPDYHDAGNVQIQRVRLWQRDTDVAWQMYQGGDLDTARVPTTATLTTVQEQELRYVHGSAVFYHIFSASQPPFDNPLVRKAFVAATDRRGLVRSVFGEENTPAHTFTPPGISGHVDGEAEDVGIAYDPTQAQQWLADAGYPDGEGLPDITLYSYTGDTSEAVNRYLIDSWARILGAAVVSKTLSGFELVNQCGDGSCQIHMLGWGADYPDAYNYLHDAVVPARSRFGNWSNSTYDNLLAQSEHETDLVARQSLFTQAEEILVEQDAAMMPLYYRSHPVATKAYLERTYPTFGAFDIAGWRITRRDAVINTGGGSLTSYDGTTSLTFGAGVFTDTVVLTHTPTYVVAPGGDLGDIGHPFDVTAVYSASQQSAKPAPGQTYSLTVAYDGPDIGTVREETLALYYWNGSQWVREPTSQLDIASQTVMATPDHFSRWAIFGETERVYLPAILNRR